MPIQIDSEEELKEAEDVPTDTDTAQDKTEAETADVNEAQDAAEVETADTDDTAQDEAKAGKKNKNKK